MKKVKFFLRGRLISCILLLAALLCGAVALAILLPRLLAPIAVLERVLSFAAALWILGSRLSAQSKSRRIVLLLIPWAGLIFCLFLIQKPSQRKLAPMSREFSDPLSNDISTLSRRGCALAGCYAESVEYFRTGREMFERMIGDLEEAEHEILLDFYLISHGVFFDSVLSILEKKARIGLDVRLVYDGFGCSHLPRKFASELRARGIKTSVFHPVHAFSFRKLNRRDHRKLLVIDRKIAYTGGVNLSDEYIGEIIRFGHWKDSGIRLTGEPAERFAALFRERSADEAEGPQEKGIPCVVFGDKADKSERLGEEILFRIISSAHRTLYLCTPYLAPGEKLLTALISAAGTADVRILIPHIPDKKSVFALSRSYARQLISAGLKVREYTAGFLHAKSLTSDGNYVLIGSYNLDERSLRYQAECGAFLYDETLCRNVDRDFLSAWETSVCVPKAKLKESLTAFFLRLFQPLF